MAENPVILLPSVEKPPVFSPFTSATAGAVLVYRRSCHAVQLDLWPCHMAESRLRRHYRHFYFRSTGRPSPRCRVLLLVFLIFALKLSVQIGRECTRTRYIEACCQCRRDTSSTKTMCTSLLRKFPRKISRSTTKSSPSWVIYFRAPSNKRDATAGSRNQSSGINPSLTVRPAHRRRKHT